MSFRTSPASFPRSDLLFKHGGTVIAPNLSFNPDPRKRGPVNFIR